MSSREKSGLVVAQWPRTMKVRMASAGLWQLKKAWLETERPGLSRIGEWKDGQTAGLSS